MSVDERWIVEGIVAVGAVTWVARAAAKIRGDSVLHGLDVEAARDGRTGRRVEPVPHPLSAHTRVADGVFGLEVERRGGRRIIDRRRPARSAAGSARG